MKLKFCLVLLTILPLISKGNDCTLPMTSFLELRLSNLLAAQGGEGTDAVVIAQDTPHYTCKVQGTTMGTYQELSVVMNYITDGNNNPRIRQFELDCITGGGSNDWQERSGSLSSILSDSFIAYVNLGTLTSCSKCHEDYGNASHCKECDPACNIGLMRCTGSDCCVAFEDNKCINDTSCTENNFVANEENNFTCACEISSCPDGGYSFNASSCSCYLTNICLANNPCANNGVCTLESSPDQYTCNCTGTEYIGTNCTECTLVCNEGYTADSTCTCQLDDICKADNPCANNGECTLGSSPDQYTCNCTGTNYMGTNCTVCGLQCSNGGTVDSTCTSCMCSPMYTGVLCDTEVNYCTDDIDCGQYGSCINDHEQMTYKCSCDEGWTGSSCTDCTVSNCIDCNGSPPVCERCDNDYIISSGTCVAKVDPCTSVPCSNDGTCRSSTDSTYECACTEAWTGAQCTECASGYGTRNTSDAVVCVPCDISNCRDCIRNYLECAECADDYFFNSERTSCVVNEQDRRLLTGIIIGSVLVGLLLMLVIVLVVVRATNHTHFNQYKRNTEKRKVVSNNPLYEEETQFTQI